MGPLTRFFADDHRRLGALLAQAIAGDTSAYETFRGGILRHIGMEERVLIPAARQARGGQALPVARLLRVDHGAIASLLVPPPREAILRRLAALLEVHNRIEEEPGGLYAVCDELLADEAPALLETLRAYPPVPLAPHQDGRNVHRHIEETVELARQAWAEARTGDGSV
jgi:hypothetical protein